MVYQFCHINPAFAGELNCFKQLRALLVLHDRGNEPESEPPSEQNVCGSKLF
jgi:hypothetical protein